jgi:hypothetical protein
MAATEQKLVVFSHLDTDWVPCGQLTLTEDGAKLLASRQGPLPAQRTALVRWDQRRGARCLGTAGNRVSTESTRKQSLDDIDDRTPARVEAGLRGRVQLRTSP